MLDKAKSFRPLLLLGYADSAYAAQVSRHFRRQGWEVRQAIDGPDVRRLAHYLAPAAVILDVDLPGQSGWLTAAKLRLDRPGLKIFLVGEHRSESNERLAAFVGAARFISRHDGPLPLSDEILGAVKSATVA